MTMTKKIVEYKMKIVNCSDGWIEEQFEGKQASCEV